MTISNMSTVPDISNYDGTDVCPFEKLAGNCQKPSQLLAALQSLSAKSEQ